VGRRIWAIDRETTGIPAGVGAGSSGLIHWLEYALGREKTALPQSGRDVAGVHGQSGIRCAKDQDVD